MRKRLIFICASLFLMLGSSIAAVNESLPQTTIPSSANPSKRMHVSIGGAIVITGAKDDIMMLLNRRALKGVKKAFSEGH